MRKYKRGQPAVPFYECTSVLSLTNLYTFCHPELDSVSFVFYISEIPKQVRNDKLFMRRRLVPCLINSVRNFGNLSFFNGQGI
jgi:hypothetical protein